MRCRERQRAAADLAEPLNRPDSIRRLYAAACLTTLLVAAHISFVPYNFRVPEWSAIMQIVEDAMRPGIYSRANFVANILMFVPIGCFGAGALASGRQLRAAALALAGLMGAAVVASFVLEGMQLFLPERTATITDVAAQAFGALAGISLYQVAGRAITAWVARARGRARDNPALPLLQVASAFFIIVSLVPLDVTLSGSTLIRKFRDGQILLVPFSGAATIDLIPATMTDLLMTAPIGALAALMVFPLRTMSAAAAAWCAGFGVIAGVELCQVIVRSRVADVTDVLVGSVGVACGVAAARLFSAGEPRAVERSGVVGRFALAIALALHVLVNWSPFDFTVSGTPLIDWWPAIVQVPFYGYYLTGELQAVTTLAAKLATLLPIAVLTAVVVRTTATPRRDAWFLTTILVGFFAIVELGQLFLPTRYPDISDIILGGGTVAAVVVLDLRMQRGR